MYQGHNLEGDQQMLAVDQMICGKKEVEFDKNFHNINWEK